MRLKACRDHTDAAAATAATAAATTSHSDFAAVITDAIGVAAVDAAAAAVDCDATDAGVVVAAR